MSQGSDSLLDLGEGTEYILKAYNEWITGANCAVGSHPWLMEPVTNVEDLLWAQVLQRNGKALEWVNGAMCEGSKTSLASVQKMLLFLLSQSLSSDIYF